MWAGLTFPVRTAPRRKNPNRGETGDVAGTITWEQLRELAAFRAEHGCAVSLYVGLDPSSVPTAANLASHVRSLHAHAERQFHERRASLSHWSATTSVVAEVLVGAAR